MSSVRYYIHSELSLKKIAASCLAAAFVPALLFLSSCSSDLGRKFSRDPVVAGAFGKQQEEGFSALLQKYVNGESKVSYSDWRSNSEDMGKVKSFLSAIAIADVKSMGEDELKSFYINTYNILTIDLILSRYEETMGGASSPYPNERSIRNIGNLDAAIWDQVKWKVSGQELSLNDLEHKLLRPMGDARIHFAIVCASKGCPPLLNRAFSPATLNATLEQLSSSFVNSGHDTTFNVAAKLIKTSNILNWFSADFDKSFGSLKGFFAKYVTVVDPQTIDGMRVSYVPYDWTLNEPDPQAPAPIAEPEVPGSGTETPPGSGTEERPVEN